MYNKVIILYRKQSKKKGKSVTTYSKKQLQQSYKSTNKCINKVLQQQSIVITQQKAAVNYKGSNRIHISNLYIFQICKV